MRPQGAPGGGSGNPAAGSWPRMINNRVFRWIAVIPGALLAVLAATFPWHFFLLMFSTPEAQESISPGLLVQIFGLENVERAGYGFITPLVLIAVAARIAPNYKLATAVTASLLLITVIVAAEVFISLNPRHYFTHGVIPILIANILTVVAIFVAFTFARPWWERGKLPVAKGVI
jgi:hypothetical protein